MRCGLCGIPDLGALDEWGTRKCANCGAHNIVAKPRKRPRLGEDDMRRYLNEVAEERAEDRAVQLDHRAIRRGEPPRGGSMSNVRRGNAAEVRTAKILQQQGWVVGSRRHIPGPGDLLAVKNGIAPSLIEVKSGLSPYQHFRRADRAEMALYARNNGMTAELAYWAPRAKTHRMIEADEWAETVIALIVGGLVGVVVRGLRAQREVINAFHAGYMHGAASAINEVARVVEVSDEELAAIERLRQQRKDAPWN